MIKRILLAAAGTAMSLIMSGATLRVNNSPESGAQFTSFAEAQEAAQDGDVIIVDGSAKSYGNIDITKKITVQGPGYFLAVNDETKEGYSPATFDEVNLKCDGIKITGLCVEGKINMRANNLIVTRCYVNYVNLCTEYSYTSDHISNGVIHQNFIQNGIGGDSYSSPATYMQVTNNIISNGYNSMFCNMNNSVISRNTALSEESGVRQLTNCVIENNISYNIEDSYWNNKDNTYSNNHNIKDSRVINEVYGQNNKRTDATIKASDATFGIDMGAFSGDDPYVLSGLSAGPVLQDIQMPESVVQGEELKVTVKIGTSR